MQDIRRFAIYYAPEPGPLAEFGAAWLGWDPETGRARPSREYAGLPRPAAEITETPGRYGLHGTLKPPFRLAEGTSAEALHRAIEALAHRLAPVTLDGLVLSRLGHFLALTPAGRATDLALLASHTVMELDSFRAPPDADEIARRRPDSLNETQRALLRRWGYPYVMEEFRFHLTLTGRLGPDELALTEAVLRPVVEPLLPAPFEVTGLCLFGEAADGRFHNLHRYTLSG